MINTGQLARIALVTFLIVGGFLVLEPFMTAILFAAVICVSTWSFYQGLWVRLGRRDMLAAAVMTLLLLVALIVPMAYLAANLADSATALFEHLRPKFEHPNPFAPEWLRNLPLIGESLGSFWQRMATSQGEFVRWLSQYKDPARELALRGAQGVGAGLMQLILVVVVAFFFYRDGAKLSENLVIVARKLGDDLGIKMLDLSGGTVKAVMLGIFGTAVAQSVVAWLGFMIAGAPAPLLLATATFFLSMIPVGPPLIWGGAALWLFNQGEIGWAIFLIVYGVFAISSVDNIVKPILISHSAKLPLLLIILGILGGAIAFGLIGIFLGPTLLALGLKLIQHWIAAQQQKIVEAP
ncbi:MAG: AI-2E family transporter [Methylophilaceae bacterium]|jgi:predicted PurR-regulated permease PerM